jgi:hypothetical protein
MAARMMASHGEAMTLARDGEATTIAVQGKRIQGGTEDIGNSAVQQVFRVKIGTAEILASSWAVKAPKFADQITIGSKVRSIRDVRPLNDSGSTVLYELEVAG